MKYIFAILALLTLAGNAAAQDEGGNYIQMGGTLAQGGLVSIEATPYTQITLNNVPVEEFSGKYYLAFPRDAAANYMLDVRYPNGVVEKYNLPIQQIHRDVQSISGVDDAKANPNMENTKLIQKEAFLINRARNMAHYPCFRILNFQRPSAGTITGKFGSQRIYNGKPGAPHSGIDFAQPEGAPVYAPEHGKVIYIENMFLTGLTMAIDHGCGVSSTFMHLSASDVQVGDIIKQGQVVARVGSTGLATGPHLHWSLNLRQTRLDPLLVLQ